MLPDTFKSFQKELGLSNTGLGWKLHRTAQSVSNYRTGRQAIPSIVAHVLQQLVTERRARVRREIQKTG